MSARSEGTLLHGRVSDLSQQLAPFTRERLLSSRPTGSPYYMLAFRQPTRLARDLYLVIKHFCAVRAGAVAPVGYHYSLEDADGKEIIAYHWHPTSAVTAPHLHIGSGARAGRPELTRAHIPTGQITWSELTWLVRELTSAQAS